MDAELSVLPQFSERCALNLKEPLRCYAEFLFDGRHGGWPCVSFGETEREDFLFAGVQHGYQISVFFQEAFADSYIANSLFSIFFATCEPFLTGQGRAENLFVAGPQILQVILPLGL